MKSEERRKKKDYMVSLRDGDMLDSSFRWNDGLKKELKRERV